MQIFAAPMFLHWTFIIFISRHDIFHEGVYECQTNLKKKQEMKRKGEERGGVGGITRTIFVCFWQTEFCFHLFMI